MCRQGNGEDKAVQIGVTRSMYGNSPEFSGWALSGTRTSWNSMMPNRDHLP